MNNLLSLGALSWSVCVSHMSIRGRGLESEVDIVVSCDHRLTHRGAPTGSILPMSARVMLGIIPRVNYYKRMGLAHRRVGQLATETSWPPISRRISGRASSPLPTRRAGLLRLRP